MNAQHSLDVLITELIDSGEAPDLLDDATLDAFSKAQQSQTLLQQLDSLPAPAGFTRRVQSRLRRRSGGRLFTPINQPFGHRMSVDAFVVVAVVVMAACWLMLDKAPLVDGPLYPDTPASTTPP